MKQREFWVSTNTMNADMEKPSYTTDYYAMYKVIHVREVSPELDAAYAECEKWLKESAEYECYTQCGCQSKAELLLAVLKKARSQE